jgi:hypothetical protein
MSRGGSRLTGLVAVVRLNPLLPFAFLDLSLT